MIYGFVVLCLCVLVNSCLSAFEMGLVTVRQSSLKLLIDNGSRAAVSALRMRQRLEHTLSIIQVGITVVAITSGAVMGWLASEWGQPFFEWLGVSKKWSEIVSLLSFTFVVTYITVVFGELLPKSIAARYPSRIVFFFVSAIRVLDKLFSPLVFIFEHSTRLLVRLLHQFGFAGTPSALDEADEAFAIHELAPRHRRYVANLVKLRRTKVGDLVLPWAQVASIDLAMSRSQVEQLLIGTGHTRVPVMNEGKVEGLLNAKQFLARADDDWQQLVRPIIQVADSAAPLRVLRIMQTKRSHMCVVTAKTASSPLGIVTLEDIFEEIVGDLYDEDD